MSIEIEPLLDELEHSTKKTIIVEGLHDKQALEKFGCENIITLDRPLYQIVEFVDDLNPEEVIILTDLDKHGKKLYHFFYTELTKRGLKIDNALRHLISKTQLNQIEGLAHYVERRKA